MTSIKTLKSENAKLKKELIQGRHYKTNFWELYHPDGTSSMTNYNPVEELKKKLDDFKKEIDDRLYNLGIAQTLFEGNNKTSNPIIDAKITELEVLKQKLFGAGGSE